MHDIGQDGVDVPNIEQILSRHVKLFLIVLLQSQLNQKLQYTARKRAQSTHDVVLDVRVLDNLRAHLRAAEVALSCSISQVVRAFLGAVKLVEDLLLDLDACHVSLITAHGSIGWNAYRSCRHCRD